jgi:hypothetical protein
MLLLFTAEARVGQVSPAEYVAAQLISKSGAVVTDANRKPQRTDCRKAVFTQIDE